MMVDENCWATEQKERQRKTRTKILQQQCWHFIGRKVGKLVV